MRKELAGVMRQISSSVSFLPLLADLCEWGQWWRVPVLKWGKLQQLWLGCYHSTQSWHVTQADKAFLMSVRHATCCESGSSVVIGSNLRMHLGGFLAPQREACFGAAAPHTSSCV